MKAKDKDKEREVGTWKRTGTVQTEQTKTGVITTMEEVNSKTKARRFVQVGYTSVMTRRDKDDKLVKYLDGLSGQRLVDSMR
jgi:hypothetical protein